MKKRFLLGNILLLSMFTLSSCIVINTNPRVIESSIERVDVSQVSNDSSSVSDVTNGDYESVTYKPVVIKNVTYYELLENKTWTGEYHQDNFDSAGEMTDIENQVVDYEGYLKILEKVNDIDVAIKHVSDYYTDKNSNYIILTSAHQFCRVNFSLIDCITENNKITIFGNEIIEGTLTSESNVSKVNGSGFLVVIPTNMPVGTNIEYNECYSKEEIEDMRNFSSIPEDQIIVKKPVIYLYPEKETDISVELVNKDKITCSYPKYNDIWKVKASPDGSLVDIQTGRSLYALYYEANVGEIGVSSEGFIVKGSESAAFLEEKLSILGLNEREAEEFIIYWLPQLESNKYNYIRFATEEEINSNMGLRITPEPDTVIRVNMLFKGLDAPIDTHEQQLNAVERNGYTVVEWGGTELK